MVTSTGIKAQVQQQPFSGFQSSACMIYGKAKTGFQFHVQIWSVPHSGSRSSARKPHLDTRFESCQNGRKSSGYAFGTFTYSREKAIGGSIPDLVQSATLLSSSSLFVQDSALPQFPDQWKSTNFQ